MQQALRFKSLGLALATCLVLLGVYIARPVHELVGNLDRVVRIVRFQFRGPRPPDPSLRVIGITQNDVSAFAGTGILYPPFPRDIHAVSLRRLADAGARTVVVDILFSEEGSWSSVEDEALRDALLYCRDKGCNVILAAAIDSSMNDAAQTLLQPSDIIMEAQPLLGGSNALAKLSYKFEERIREKIELAQGGSFYSQAVAAFRLKCEAEGRELDTELARFSPPGVNAYRINYNGRFDSASLGGVTYDYVTLWPEVQNINNLEHMQQINALRDTRESGGLDSAGAAELDRLLTLDAQQQDALRRAFEGTTVFLGSRNSADNDYFTTPFGQMFGVDTNAQAYDTLASGAPIHAVEPRLVFAYCFLLALLAWSLSLLRPIIRGALAGLITLLAISLFNLLLFRFASIELASVLPLACFLLPFTASISFSGYGEEQAKRAIRSTFSRYVSSELVDQVLRNPTLAQIGHGVKREAAVLFSDIRNYSTISEHMEPQQVIEMLNTYFGEAAEVIRRHGGSVDKYLGDGMMASFGAIVPRENPAVDAIEAAIETIKVLYHKVHPALAQLGYPAFKVGLGMHFGAGVSGNIGSASRFDLSFIGDTTNLASRVESTTKEYGWAILVTREIKEAAEAAGARFDFELVGQQLVKGRNTPVELYRVLDPADPGIYKL